MREGIKKLWQLLMYPLRGEQLLIGGLIAVATLVLMDFFYRQNISSYMEGCELPPQIHLQEGESLSLVPSTRESGVRHRIYGPALAEADPCAREVRIFYGRVEAYSPSRHSSLRWRSDRGVYRLNGATASLTVTITRDQLSVAKGNVQVELKNNPGKGKILLHKGQRLIANSIENRLEELPETSMRNLLNNAAAISRSTPIDRCDFSGAESNYRIRLKNGITFKGRVVTAGNRICLEEADGTIRLLPRSAVREIVP